MLSSAPLERRARARRAAGSDQSASAAPARPIRSPGSRAGANRTAGRDQGVRAAPETAARGHHRLSGGRWGACAALATVYPSRSSQVLHPLPHRWGPGEAARLATLSFFTSLGPISRKPVGSRCHREQPETPRTGTGQGLGLCRNPDWTPSLLNQPSHTTSLPGSCHPSMSRLPSAPRQLGHPGLRPVPATAGTRPVTGNFTSIAFVYGHELQNPGCVLFFLLINEPCTSPPIPTVAWCMPGGPGESSRFHVAEALKTNIPGGQKAGNHLPPLR